MAKNKPKRTLDKVARSQHVTEASSRDKFSQVEDLAKGSKGVVQPSSGRISPQLSCTISPEDKDDLTDLTLYLSGKAGRVLNVSNVIRALIRYGKAHKDRLEL